MEYTKIPLSLSDQADLLISRGLIADKYELIEQLSFLNYYRLTAYLYPYRNVDNSFRQGTSLELILYHYEFDRNLRFLMMDAIERIEVAIRSHIAYLFSHHYGPFGYTEKSNLPGISDDVFGSWLSEIRFDTIKSKETFVEHFRVAYGDNHTDLPIWMLVEVVSFGKIYTLFRGIDNSLQKTISGLFSVNDVIFNSWIKTINYVRNICAHHGRLWNRELAIKPYLPRRNKYPEWHRPFTMQNNKIFSILSVMVYLLGIINKKNHWKEELCKLISDYNQIDISEMGFSKHWMSHEIWSKGKNY